MQLCYNVSIKLIKHIYMFTIKNQVSGKTFQTEGKNCILDDAIAHGINLVHGCQKGACGQCKATIIEGEVDYEGETPSGITPEEVADGMALLCQCKAKSDIILVVAEE
jgi:CDP-4-dehydro-6-deoxyglucose reductase